MRFVEREKGGVFFEFSRCFFLFFLFCCPSDAIFLQTTLIFITIFSVFSFVAFYCDSMLNVDSFSYFLFCGCCCAFMCLLALWHHFCAFISNEREERIKKQQHSSSSIINELQEIVCCDKFITRRKGLRQENWSGFGKMSIKCSE